MQPEPLCLIATCDLVAVVRGRAVPASQLDSHLATGVGWVPANLSLSPFGGIVNPNPFGSLGDLRLLPDLSSRCHVELGDSTPLDLVLGDLHELDGTPWVACPRAFLRNALADLEREAGLLMQSSFEQEFQLPTDVRAAPFSLSSLRKLEPFASKLFAALAAAGLEPECFVPEYAADQYEIPIAPAIGVAAADRAIVLRELARELARSDSRTITFTPIMHPDGGGNGTHIHLSLIDATRQPKMGTPTELSKMAGAFAAGILRHAPALVALTAPTPASFVRLQPHRWSTGIACLAAGNREAMLRMPTPISIGGRPAEPQTDSSTARPMPRPVPTSHLEQSSTPDLRAFATSSRPPRSFMSKRTYLTMQSDPSSKPPDSQPHSERRSMPSRLIRSPDTGYRPSCSRRILASNVLRSPKRLGTLMLLRHALVTQRTTS